MDITKDITKEIFEKYVPAAKTADRNTSVFNRMQQYFETGLIWLREYIFGEAFIAHLDDEDIKPIVLEYLCVNGFYLAIPSLDLVLTGTGFGVVSTQDTAPASKDRVERLRSDMCWKGLLVKSRLFKQIVKIDGWGESQIAIDQIASLYYDPEMLARFGPVNPDQSMMESWKRILTYRHDGEMSVAREISPEYYKELLKKIRTAKLTSYDHELMNHALRYIAASIVQRINGDPHIDAAIWGLRDHMERNIDNYPEYKASKLYQALHGEHYENKKEDSAFFFTA